MVINVHHLITILVYEQLPSGTLVCVAECQLFLMRLPPDNIMRANYLAYRYSAPCRTSKPFFSHWPWMGNDEWSLETSTLYQIKSPVSTSTTPKQRTNGWLLWFRVWVRFIWIRFWLRLMTIVATKIILVMYLILLHETPIHVTFSIKTKLYTCLK